MTVIVIKDLNFCHCVKNVNFCHYCKEFEDFLKLYELIYFVENVKYL